jgi:hypothetical protein
MGALPTPEPVVVRYATYVEELHEFLDTYGIPYGSPDDIFPVAERLRSPGPFAGDLSLVIRAILFSEGGSMPRAQLLQVLALAIGGPEMERAPKEYAQPLRQIFAFLTAVRGRPLNGPPGTGGQLVPFPSGVLDQTTEDRASGIAAALLPAQPLRPALETRLEPLSNPRPEQTYATGMPEPTSPAISPSFRNVLIASGVGILLAVVLFFIFRTSRSDSSQTNSRPAAAGFSVNKPTAYGEAFQPADPPVRSFPVATYASEFSHVIETPVDPGPTPEGPGGENVAGQNPELSANADPQPAPLSAETSGTESTANTDPQPATGSDAQPAASTSPERTVAYSEQSAPG